MRVEYTEVPFPPTFKKGDDYCHTDPAIAPVRKAIASRDLDALILVWGDGKSPHAEFAIFDVAYFGFGKHGANGQYESTSGHPDAYEIQRIDSPDSMDTTTDLANARCAARGFIKFDGCVNYEYPDSKACMPHQCGLSGFQREFGRWCLLYHVALEMIGSADWCPWDANPIEPVAVPLDEAKRIADERFGMP